MVKKIPVARKKVGAKPKAPHEKYSERVEVVMPASELDAAFRHMKRLKITQSEYIRRALADFHAFLDTHLDSKSVVEPPKPRPSRPLTAAMLPAEYSEAVKHARMQGLREMSEHVRRAMAYFRETLEKTE